MKSYLFLIGTAYSNGFYEPYDCDPPSRYIPVVIAHRGRDQIQTGRNTRCALAHHDIIPDGCLVPKLSCPSYVNELFVPSIKLKIRNFEENKKYGVVQRIYD